MHSRAQILRQITAIAASELGHEGPATEASRLIEDLKLDSLRALSLIVAIENHFRVQLQPEDETGLETVGDLVSVLESRLAADT